MKKLFILTAALSIAGCSTLDYRGDCYFAEQPAQYLVNGQGKYINLNGEVVTQPVLNPYYAQYQKCYPSVEQEKQSLIKYDAVRSLLKDRYIINTQTYHLAGPRTVKEGGAYVESVFKAVDDEKYLKQEVFFYHNDRTGFPAIFLRDINRDEGTFEAKTVNGQSYIIGKNDLGAYVIYVVKNVLDHHISIVQYVVKKPFNPQDIATIVKDLGQV